jgi:hypothetical protein
MSTKKDAKMVPEFIHTDRRSPRMVDPYEVANKVDKNGNQVMLLTEAVNILANKVQQLEQQLATNSP